MKITDILAKKKFTLSFELIPPRNGAPLDEILGKVEKLKGLGADFLSVTKGAGGSLRAGTLPLTYFIKEKCKIECIAHFTCIDQKRHEIENQLNEYNYFGIENLLALRGDRPDVAPDVAAGECKVEGDYEYAWQLVGQIREMNDGKYLARKGFDKGEFREGLKANFCIGVAAYVDSPVEYLKKKADGGAHYAVTQMFFDAKDYGNFVRSARAAGIKIPIIPGIKPLTSYEQAVKLEEKFKIKIPEKLKADLQQNGREAGIKFTVDFCRELKKSGAPGLHIFIVNDLQLAIDVLSGLSGSL